MIANKKTSIIERRQLRTYAHSFRCREQSRRDIWPSIEPVEASKAKDFSSVLRSAQQLSLFVEMDPEILGGTPRIKDTRVPVYGVLNAIEEYGSIEGATNAYRSLTEASVKDALRFAANVLESPFEDDNPDSD